MVTLFVTSSEKGSGKTTLCAGLGKHLRTNGKKVGFFKPLIGGNTLPADGIESDADFMKHILALEEPVNLLCPVFSDENNLRNGLTDAYAKVSQGKDVVIIEDASRLSQSSYGIVESLNARMIVVESYSKELQKTMNSYKNFGKYLLGVVVNKVPKNRIEQVRGEFGKAGINILGVIPEDRTLLALTIGELASYIQGEILSGADKSAEVVENFMLGAMTVDHGPIYYGRKANKAVVLKSERPDMQLAALETSTRCLVLTGVSSPTPVVLAKAAEKKVPIITTKGDVTTVVTTIEGAQGKTRFNQENKLSKLTEIMEKHFDFPTVYKGLGLAS